MLSIRSLIPISIVLSGSILQARGQTPLSTAFTYQGQLKATGMPAISTADFQVALFDADAGGNQVGATLLKENTAIVNGLFTLSLDFGASALNGDARFLQVSVRSPAGAGAFNALSPRQALSGTPYALQTRGLFVDSATKIGIGTTTPLTKLDVRGGAMSIENLGDQADLLWLNCERPWVFRQQGTGAGTALKLQSVGGGGNKNFLIDTDGAVGIGTDTPAAALHISNESPALILQDSGDRSTQVGSLTFWNSNPSETGWVGFGTAGSPDLSVVNARPSGDIRLEASGGNVLVPQDRIGIGIDQPESGLHVVTNLVKAGIFETGSSDGTAVTGIAPSTSEPLFFPSNGGVFISMCPGGGTGLTAVAQGLTGTNYGILAGCFNDDSFGIYCTDNFAATGTKSFRIDHPFDPENKYLFHYCAESPEPLNIYNGVVQTDANGFATVQLPDYFEEINRDFRYQLTCIGEFAQAIVSEKVKHNSFVIRTDKPNIEVSWEVKGVRNDLWVRKHGAPVVKDKLGRERGTYQDPKLYSQPEERGTFYRPQFKAALDQTAVPQKPKDMTIGSQP